MPHLMNLGSFGRDNKIRVLNQTTSSIEQFNANDAEHGSATAINTLSANSNEATVLLRGGYHDGNTYGNFSAARQVIHITIAARPC